MTALDAVVPLAQDNVVELYRVHWPPDPLLVQARPGIGLVVMKRASGGGGVLLALPAALVPAGSLPLREQEGHGVIGLHCRVEIPAVRMQDDGNHRLGIDLDLYLVDLAAPGLAAVTPLSEVPQEEDMALVGFHEDLDVIPDPEELLSRANFWVASQVDPRGVGRGGACRGGGGRAARWKCYASPSHSGSRTDGFTKSQCKSQGQRGRQAEEGDYCELGHADVNLDGDVTCNVPAAGSKRTRADCATLWRKRGTSPPMRVSEMPVSKSVAAFAQMMGPPPWTAQDNRFGQWADRRVQSRGSLWLLRCWSRARH